MGRPRTLLFRSGEWQIRPLEYAARIYLTRACPNLTQSDSEFLNFKWLDKLIIKSEKFKSRVEERISEEVTSLNLHMKLLAICLTQM